MYQLFQVECELTKLSLSYFHSLRYTDGKVKLYWDNVQIVSHIFQIYGNDNKMLQISDFTPQKNVNSEWYIDYEVFIPIIRNLKLMSVGIV